jgi:hypothetical protein
MPMPSGSTHHRAWILNALDHLEQCKRHDEARVAKMRQTAWTPINGHLYRLALLP